MMDFKTFKYLILSDLYRYHGSTNIKYFFIQLLWGIGYKYTFWMRAYKYFSQIKMAFLFKAVSRLMLHRCLIKYGLQISPNAEIGPGFYIGHFGYIVVNGLAKIGKNCNISPGVVIGGSHTGSKKGVPILGDNIYIATGAKIIGKIKIGNNVVIGANAVVVDDVPDNAIVAGVPAKIISYNGSAGYLHRIDYDKKR